MIASLKQCNGSTAFTIYALQMKESQVQLHERNFLGAKSIRNMRFFRIIRKAKECGHAWLPKDALSVVVPNWPATGSGERTQGTREFEKEEFIELRIGNGIFDPTFYFPF